MGRRWVVDTSNVVGSRPDGWWRDRPRALARLLDEIARWRDVTGEPVLAVADGHPSPRVPEGGLFGIEMRFAHSTKRDAADDEIVRLLEAEADPAGCVVVTSDRHLRSRVAELGGGTEGAGRFLDRIADIEPRRHDRAVLAHFGIDESALLGRGGEARVFALDHERVLRLPHPGIDPSSLDERRRMLDAIRPADPAVALPEVLEHRVVEGRTVVVERRLRGSDALEALAEPRTDRRALIRHHLTVARWVAELPCPAGRFGELWGTGAVRASSFAEWSTARLAASLSRGGADFGGLDPAELTADLSQALPEPEPQEPRLVHLDVFLGNMLAEDSRVTALLDFGPMAIGGPADLDPLIAIAYLAPEITPTADEGDHAVARAWAVEVGLADALEPAERWTAAYWTGAPDDGRLRQWCTRILLGR